MRQALKRLRRDQKGSSSIEFVLWMPVFAVLLMMTVDASFLYMNMTKMENAARDGARRVATGQFNTNEIVLVIMEDLPAPDLVVDATCSTDDYACVTVMRPASGMMAFGIFKPLLGESMRTEIRIRKEPGVSHMLQDTMQSERTA